MNPSTSSSSYLNAACGNRQDLPSVAAVSQKKAPTAEFAQTVSGASVGVSLAASVQVVSASQLRSTGSPPRLTAPPGILAQRYASTAGFLMAPPAARENRAISSRPADSSMYSPVSAKLIAQGQSPFLDSIDHLLGLSTSLSEEDASANYCQVISPRSAASSEMSAVRSAYGFLKRSPPSLIGGINAMTSNEKAFRQTSQTMLTIRQRPVIQKINAKKTELEPFEKALTQSWCSELTGGQIKNGEDVSVWRSLLQGFGQLRKSGFVPDRRNFLITVVTDSTQQTVYKFLSVSGSLRSGERDKSGVCKLKVKSPVVSKRAIVLAAPGLPGTPGNECRVAQNKSQFYPGMQPGFRFIGYDDLVIKTEKSECMELRAIPRAFTPTLNKQSGHLEIHDRARDTETVVLNALAVVYRQLRQDNSLDGVSHHIYMFSTNPMCPSCEAAASLALTSEEFRHVTRFKLFN